MNKQEMTKTKVLCEKVMGIPLWTKTEFPEEFPALHLSANGRYYIYTSENASSEIDFTTSADCDALVEAFVREYGISFSLVEHKTGIVDGSYIQMIHCNSSHVVHTKMTTISGAYTTSAKNIAVCEAIYQAVTS
jgi:hypothetical protein